jgi:opacity protein-like surface antigen
MVIAAQLLWAKGATVMAGQSHNEGARRVRLFGSILLFLVLSSLPASADDAEDFYQYRASAYAGAFIPQTVSLTGSGFLSGLPISATGKLASKVGWATGGLLGYALDTPGWRWLNIDLSAGYVTSNLDYFSGTISSPVLGSIAGLAPTSGDFHTYAGFVNFLATPFGIREVFNNKVTPFIGIGPGVASTTVRLQSLFLRPMSLPVNETSNETDFAFDATLGADYALGEQWELGIAYQYTWINTKHLGASSTFLTNSGASTGHSVGLVLEYRFGRASN